MFRSQAAETPDAIAIHHAGRTIGYAALDAWSNRIANALRTRGVGREDVVALCTTRTIGMIAAMMGVLKAGAAYVPLDPTYPPARLDYMLRDSGARAMIVQGDVPAGLDRMDDAIDLDADDGWIEAMDATAPEHGGSPTDLAYVLYTSGSTGMPKGVMLEHTACHLVDWALRTYSVADLARVAATTSLCFDPSIFEIFTPLSCGGAVVLKDSPLDPYVAEDAPTMLTGVPTVMGDLAARGVLPASVRVVNVGGERVTADLVETIRRASPGVRIYNHYGPTEATTAMAVGLVGCVEGGRDPSIGMPIGGTSVRIVDGDGAEVPDGAEGELHVHGPMVARGYVNKPDLTAASFIAGVERGYRTGDIVRRNADGTLDYVCRAGDFIKLNGRRIAPGEIESAMVRIDGVRAAAVTIASDARGRDRLVGHVTLEDGASIDLRGLRTALAEWLPIQMLPSHLHVHDALPLSVNRKIDRSALPGVPEPRMGDRVDPTEYLPITRAAADIIADELGLCEVGPDDDFFELGGDSLAAVAVALQLETAIGRPVSPALLSHAPTPRLLHEAFENERQTDEVHVTCLQPDGEQPPIYCLPDIYGRALSFITLAARLGPDQPVCSLSVGPAADSLIADPSLDRLVDAYIAAIRARTPTGPYRIAGYSFGGAFAQELARRLHEGGDVVSLVLIDAPNRRAGIGAAYVPWLLRAAVEGVRQGGVMGALRRSYVRSRNLATYMLRRYHREVPDWVSDNDRALTAAHIVAHHDHVPKPYRGRTLLVVCRKQDPINSYADIDGRLGWSRLLLGEVERHVADVDHYDIVRTANVDTLAQQIRDFLECEPEPLTWTGLKAPRGASPLAGLARINPAHAVAGMAAGMEFVPRIINL